MSWDFSFSSTYSSFLFFFFKVLELLEPFNDKKKDLVGKREIISRIKQKRLFPKKITP